MIVTMQQYTDNREKVLEAENNTMLTDVTMNVMCSRSKGLSAGRQTKEKLT